MILILFSECNRIPCYVQIKELCILINESCFHAEDISQLHQSSFQLLSTALSNNCFSFQFGFELTVAADIEKFVEFFTHLNTNYVSKLRYKLLKIVVYTNGLRGSDSGENLLSLLCAALEHALDVEFVELQLHFSNCSFLNFILPTNSNSFINRLCLFDSNSCSELKQQLHRQFYLTISIHFHTLPSDIFLNFEHLERNIRCVSLLIVVDNFLFKLHLLKLFAH